MFPPLYEVSRKQTFYTPVFRRDVLWYGDVRPSQFPHFSPKCFEILSWNCVHRFIFMHARSSLNAINFRQFLQELCPFWTSNSYKYAVFRTFLLHALTYWVEMLCDFVLIYSRLSLSGVTLRQLLKELCLFFNLEHRKYVVFCNFLLHALTYWAEILHTALLICTTDEILVSSLCVNFWRSYASFLT